ncbi:hypothetical protein R5H32_04230 [Defluviimonas sp. D31]|uniref:hypothetical protein n=1 Tax=Defluviimonas sp. D31 TaxID=3083253 RepID=UPI00296ECD01|nr:hypothetical protein [Defluviimonas sp. D31]MDW4548555.1 hypothetical protein [Defluviimonas sp. D31]
MSTILKWGAVAILVLLAAVIAHDWPVLRLALPLPPSGSVEESWHQRMTVVIETSSGEVSGSAVQAIRWQGLDTAHRTTTPSNGARSRFYSQGEVVAVEVTPGRWLFALLKGAQGWRGEPGAKLGFALAVPQGAYASSVEAMALIKALPKDRPVTLPSEAYPLFVTFDDIADPKSVRQVDPADLAATFGPGVRLKAVTLAVTEEPVTEGNVEGVLGWFCSYVKPYRRLSGKSGPIADNELANNLGPGVLSIGTCK